MAINALIDPVLQLLVLLLLLTTLGYWLGRRRALRVATGRVRHLHSLPAYYGLYVAVWAGLPVLALTVLWLAIGDYVVTWLTVAQLPETIRDLPPEQFKLWVLDLKNLALGHTLAATASPTLQEAAAYYRQMAGIGDKLLLATGLFLAIGGAALAYRRIAPTLRARTQIEGLLKWFLFGCSTLAIFTTLGIVLSVLFESIRFFHLVPIHEFLFGMEWSPQTALRADQVGSSGSFGAVPLFAGTFLISAIALAVAAPIGLLAAVYLAEYAGRRVRTVAKPVLEILAGIPTVVYGFFAALIVAPQLRGLGEAIGLTVSSESALAAGLVMGIMIIPFISSLSDDVINAVPQSLRDGALALGATRSEMVLQVVFPAALPGIVGGLLLAVSRAIGETMIVVMAAGLAANLTANPLEAVTTVTVQIVTLLTGDQEFDSAKTLAAFALGLTLFVLTLILNVIALHIVHKYREQYE